jgi:hypothetical protein
MQNKTCRGLIVFGLVLLSTGGLTGCQEMQQVAEKAARGVARRQRVHLRLDMDRHRRIDHRLPVVGCGLEDGQTLGAARGGGISRHRSHHGRVVEPFARGVEIENRDRGRPSRRREKDGACGRDGDGQRAEFVGHVRSPRMRIAEPEAVQGWTPVGGAWCSIVVWPSSSTRP